MFQDIVGDYADKTVTLENFPFTEGVSKMASVHPCQHAATMKKFLGWELANKMRRKRMKKGEGEMQGLAEGVDNMRVDGSGKGKEGFKAGAAAGATGEEWEVLQEGTEMMDDDEVLPVTQYMVVFLKVGVPKLRSLACANQA